MSTGIPVGQIGQALNNLGLARRSISAPCSSRRPTITYLLMDLDGLI